MIGPGRRMVYNVRHRQLQGRVLNEEKMTDSIRRVVMDAVRVERTIRRIASQMAEQCEEGTQLALVAVGRGGVPLTLRLADQLEKLLGKKIPHGVLDVTLYRDDLSYGSKPVLFETKLEFDVDKKTVILIDDVLFTGRTVRAAMDALMEYGRPDVIRAAVLVDRGHRELPIRADFVGLWLDTVHDDAVEVILGEKSGADDRVDVISPKSGG